MNTICPYCKYKATNHETLDGACNFKDGDTSFCIECGEASVFKGRGLEKVDIFKLHPETRQELIDIRHAWLKVRRRK